MVHGVLGGGARLAAINGPHESFLLPQSVPADWLNTILLVAQYPGGTAHLVTTPLVVMVQVIFKVVFEHIWPDTACACIRKPILAPNASDYTIQKQSC